MCIIGGSFRCDRVMGLDTNSERQFDPDPVPATHSKPPAAASTRNDSENGQERQKESGSRCHVLNVGSYAANFCRNGSANMRKKGP